MAGIVGGKIVDALASAALPGEGDVRLGVVVALGNELDSGPQHAPSQRPAAVSSR